ncbi:hypothetical protein K1T71_010044 [Dendrolimus kikuchii]|uniref:Uncharacterized protein n=1 Tax=Dendrolimus kikuchii TaxID=765133 RepID=A0ACC1CQJ7_9NEOP|nr:hypothetical protein K1T71_010044 [Dendrolimus kikuchii]
MIISTKWLVLWSLWAARLVRQPTPTVLVSNGELRGLVAPDGSYRQYSGIPYGTVTKETRFQAPGPEPKFKGLFEAIDENVRCLQQVTYDIVAGQLDCLRVNVYTPLDTGPETLPVMVFFHGGGFCKGSGSPFLYGPHYLVKQGVILVTLNYRVNIQGFLCLGIKENPGNAAMKDQVAALKWIHKNIKKFGGDPDNVTIFGESAGATSVSYHIISPLTKGLFHKAILQSGSSLAPWAFQHNPVFFASLLSKTMLYETQDPKKLYKFFQMKTDEELILTRVPRKDGNIFISELLLAPCAEKVFEGEEQFLTKSPYQILTSGEYNKVPMISGFNNEEGIFFMTMDNDTTIPKIMFEKSIPNNLLFSSEEEKKEVARNFQRLYMGNIAISNKPESVLRMSRWVGEPHFNFPSLEETEIMLKTTDQPIYNYLFKYEGFRNFAKQASGATTRLTTGATHADDLFYLFAQLVTPSLFEGKTIDRLTTMWTNFAKFGFWRTTYCCFIIISQVLWILKYKLILGSSVHIAGRAHCICAV